MAAEIYSVHYADRHAAALCFRQLTQLRVSLKILALGLEKHRHRARTWWKIFLVLDEEQGANLPALLKSVRDSLSDHPLFPHLSWDFHVVPLSGAAWNFDSYDDSNFQKVFIRKRQA